VVKKNLVDVGEEGIEEDPHRAEEEMGMPELMQHTSMEKPVLQRVFLIGMHCQD
jgi:hypothetical protein